MASFSTQFGGVSPERVIEASFNQWRAVAGANVWFPSVGTSTATDCTSTNVVFALNSAYFWDPSRFADFWVCGATWKVTVYLRGANNAVNVYTLGIPTATQVDFQSLMIHEIGHRFHWGHIPDDIDQCIMEGGLTPGTTVKRFFCNRELPIVLTQFLAGTGENGIGFLQSDTTLFPTPSGWVNNAMFPTTAVGGASHLTAADGAVSPSSDTRRFLFWGDPISGTITSTPYPTLSTSTLSLSSFLNPTIAYAYSNKTWWLFGRVADLGLNDDRLWWSKSTDPGNPSSWSSPVFIAQASGATARSRLRPAAAFDAVRNRMVVVWVVNPTGRLRASTIDVGIAGGTANAWENVQDLGTEVAMGPPAIACADATLRCQLSYQTGSASNRFLGHFQVSVNAGSFSRDAETISGLSDFGPSMVGPQGPYSNQFVVAMRGSDTAGTFWRRTRTVGGASWTSWQQVGFAKSTGTGPVLTVGPDLKYRVIH